MPTYIWITLNDLILIFSIFNVFNNCYFCLKFILLYTNMRLQIKSGQYTVYYMQYRNIAFQTQPKIPQKQKWTVN